MPKYSNTFVTVNMPATQPFPNGQACHRPMMVAMLTASNGKQLRCIVWLDSGADHCVFPVSFAIALGLDPLQMQQQLTGGVGNTGNNTFYDDLTIALDNGPTFTTKVGFTAGLEAQGFGLLGQAGFFENFTVTFDQKSRLFHIEH